MARPTIGARQFARRYAARTGDLISLARSHSGGLTADYIHDLRVATRRVQMLCALLPRNTRESKDCRDFNEALRALLKATSKVRDIDTLTVTLEQRRASLPPEIFVALSRERAETLRQAKPAIKRVSAVALPATDGLPANSGKLSKRLRKRIAGRAAAIADLLTKVLKSESRMAELHALRKETKKLRYLLEMADTKPAELEVLTAWQEELGAVHDLDVAIDFLKRGWTSSGATAELQEGRHAGYLRFVAEYRRRWANSLKNSAIFSLG